LLKGVNVEFTQISQTLRNIQKQLAPLHPEASQLIEKLQQLEKQKLHATIAYQMTYCEKQRQQPLNSSSSSSSSSLSKTVLERGQSQITSENTMLRVDQMISFLAACLPVDIMPSLSDPSNYHFPQQPFNSCLFPNASLFSGFHAVTNPYMFRINNALFLGESGEMLCSVSQSMHVTDPLCAMQKLLEQRHIAPTVPDSLPGYPFAKESKYGDPFVLRTCPDVYFVGNMPSFSSTLLENPTDDKKSMQRVRLITVPNFYETKQVVLVNVKTLACSLINFSTHELFN